MIWLNILGVVTLLLVLIGGRQLYRHINQKLKDADGLGKVYTAEESCPLTFGNAEK